MINFHGKVTIDIDPKVLNGKFSKAQNELVNQVIIDCTPYVPFKQGILSNSVHVENENEIVWNTPYAQFLYYGKLMLDDRGSAYALPNTKKHVTNIDLKYSKEGHPQATSHWFEVAKQNHLQEWIDKIEKAVK